MVILGGVMQTSDLTNKDWSLALAGLITRTETTADRVLLDALRRRLTVPDLLNKKQASAFLTIAVRTLDDWRQAKIIPCIQRGGYVRFRRDDLEDFLAASTLEPRKVPPYRPRRRKTANSSANSSATNP